MELFTKLIQAASGISNQSMKGVDKSIMVIPSISSFREPSQTVTAPLSRQDALTEALIKAVEASEDKFEKLAHEVSSYKSPRTYGKMAGAAVGGVLGGQAGMNLGQTVGEELGGWMGSEAPATQQVNMIRLQQAGQEMNTTTTGASNILKSNGETQKLIAQNLRA